MGSQGSGSLEDFDGFCEFLQFLSSFFRNRELGASPAGILGDFIKQNEDIWSRPSLGESPKPWIFFIFIEIPLKINDFQWPRAIRMKKSSFFSIDPMKFSQTTFCHWDEITEVREKHFDSVATDVLGNAIKTKNQLNQSRTKRRAMVLSDFSR